MKHDLRMVDTCPSVPTSFIDNRGVVHKPKIRKWTEEEKKDKQDRIEKRFSYLKEFLKPSHLVKNHSHFIKDGEVDFEKLDGWKDDDVLMLSLCNKIV